MRYEFVFRGEDVYNHVDVGMCKTSRHYVTKSDAENQVEQSLDTYFSALAEKNLIQGSLIITQNGEPLFQRAYGFLDAKGTYKANTQTTYRIASIGKTYSNDDHAIG